ncbi:MAG: hypothetical protein CM1200mP8_5160 [Chloroflexota bacterium]|nr:MAG: hypothetical protein CM1200mP8_5160 [Chloroflexota bacterium]
MFICHLELILIGVDMKPISEISAQLGIDPQKLIMYGDFKAKIPLDTISSKNNGTGKLIVVTVSRQPLQAKAKQQRP